MPAEDGGRVQRSFEVIALKQPALDLVLAA
jgi:hypothetical protein